MGREGMGEDGMGREKMGRGQEKMDGAGEDGGRERPNKLRNEKGSQKEKEKLEITVSSQRAVLES